MESDKTAKLEDRRSEYSALRAEILQADNICLVMMGYLITAVGFLYSAKLEWLVSFLSFISLCYFTEKRFGIRKISFFIANEICQDDSGFRWEKYVEELRHRRLLRSSFMLRPYNAEVMTCSLMAISPVVNGVLVNLVKLNPTSIFWFLFASVTLTLSVVNFIKYNRA